MTEFTGELQGERFDFSQYETTVERTVAARARLSLLDDMIVERGTRADWDLLHDLHYKAESLPMGPRFWKLSLHGETIGVLVTGSPRGMLRERHQIFPNLKPNGNDTKFSNTARYKYINENFRVVSRFVIDTMYRGIGCGYRMMNLVARMEGMTFMEIQSSMSKFNLFGQKAGFKFVKPSNANNYEKGMSFLRSHFKASPQDQEALIEEIMAYPENQRKLVLQTCRDFYYSISSIEQTGKNRLVDGNSKGFNRVQTMDERATIKAIQQTCLASPMYGIWKNPNGKNWKSPQRLPLTAFEWQGPNQPFKDRT
jgi:uncharacterized protein